MKRLLLLAIFALPGADAQQISSPRLDLLETKGILITSTSPLETNSSLEKKNVGLAVLSSLLLPGMGELYVGEYGVGKYFTVAEGALWLTYASLQLYGTWLRNDARNFAGVHAGINPSGKDHQYFIDIGNYADIGQYTETILRNRQLDRLYDPATHSWQWDSEPNRILYRDLRITHDRVFNNTQFVIAAIVVNHLVSAINAGRLAVAHNRRSAGMSLFHMGASVLGSGTHPDGIVISISKTF